MNDSFFPPQVQDQDQSILNILNVEDIKDNNLSKSRLNINSSKIEIESIEKEKKKLLSNSSNNIINLKNKKKEQEKNNYANKEEKLKSLHIHRHHKNKKI